jgi:hypothetical protein
VREAPVNMQPRVAGQSSIGLAEAVYYVCKVLLAIVIGTLRQAPERD